MPSAGKVRELQRKLWAAAKQSEERRFHALYDRVRRGDVLWEAWRRVLANRGAAGVDRIALVEVEEYGVERMLGELARDLRAGTYRPAPVRRVEIPGCADVRTVIEELNPILRGWGNYFRTGNAANKFRQADDYAVKRLRSLMVKTRGRNFRADQVQQWTKTGLTGWVCTGCVAPSDIRRRRSTAMKIIGKSCAGNRTHGFERGMGKRVRKDTAPLTTNDVAATRPKREGRAAPDAERNRQRILATAREVFAEQGLDVPMEDLARQAGVGVGTLYRRYPNRADLIVAVFADKMRDYAEAAQQALADPDPWSGFCAYVERTCAMQAGDRGFTTVLTKTFPTARQLEADRDRAFADFRALVERAKAAGKLRADFVAEDMPLFLMANAGVLSTTADAAPNAWRRLVGYLTQACAATAAQPLPDPPNPRQMYRAMLRTTHHQRELGAK